MIGDAPLHRWKDVLPEQIPHASDVVLGRAGTASVRAEEGRSVFGRESLQREHEQSGSFPLADVPFRGAADPGLDDAGTEEVVAILERNREIPRERFERRTFLGRGARRNRGGRRRTQGEGGRFGPAHPDVVRLRDSVRALEIDVEALAIAEDEIDLSQFAEELEPDGCVEIRWPFNRPLRKRPDPQGVEDGLRHAVTMSLRPQDDRGSVGPGAAKQLRDRKSTRLNSSHLVISYAVFCLKKKK